MRILILLFPDDAGTGALPLSALAEPYYLFKDNGVDVVLSSPSGGSPISSISDIKSGGAWVARFRIDAKAREELADTISFDQVVIDDFDAAMCLGTIGSIWRQADGETLVARFLNSNLPVAVIPGKALDLGPQGAGSGLLIISEENGPSALTAWTLMQIAREKLDERERTKP